MRRVSGDGSAPDRRDAISRDGLPTIRIRTLDRAGSVTGVVLLDTDAARNVAGNIEVALENLGTIIDATGGVWHQGAARLGTEDGFVEIASDPAGRFEGL